MMQTQQIKGSLGRGLAMLVLALGWLTLTGCEPQARGFSLPPGDVDRGLATFTQLECNSCHRIDNVVTQLEGNAGRDLVVSVTLGGTTTRVKTYGDLVTSIINPSHKLSRGNTPDTVTEAGESRMRDYNNSMTVQQLVDLTAFLQNTYNIWVPEYTPYYFP